MRQIILSSAGWEDIVIKTKKLQTKLNNRTKYSELQEKKKNKKQETLNHVTKLHATQIQFSGKDQHPAVYLKK